jgi:hypothetical protein
MTRDELKEQIANLVVGPPMDCHITDGYWLADQISALLDGWKSPGEVEKIKVEEWWRGRHDNG